MQDDELISNTISKKPFVIIQWPSVYEGLDYAIIKKENCSSFKLSVLNAKFIVTCLVKAFNKEYSCNLLKAGSLEDCLKEFSKIINTKVSKRTAQLTWLNTSLLNYKPKPQSHIQAQLNDDFYDLYSTSIILDCACEKCLPKKTKQYHGYVD